MNIHNKILPPSSLDPLPVHPPPRLTPLQEALYSHFLSSKAALKMIKAAQEAAEGAGKAKGTAKVGCFCFCFLWGGILISILFPIFVSRMCPRNIFFCREKIYDEEFVSSFSTVGRFER